MRGKRPQQCPASNSVTRLAQEAPAGWLVGWSCCCCSAAGLWAPGVGVCVWEGGGSRGSPALPLPSAHLCRGGSVYPTGLASCMVT